MVSDDPPVPCYTPVLKPKPTCNTEAPECQEYPLPPTKDQIRNNITKNNTENICDQSTGESCMQVKKFF